MARTRSRIISTTVAQGVCIIEGRGCSTGDWSELATDHYEWTSQSTQTITDELTPGFFTLRKLGRILPANNVTILREEVQRTPVTVSCSRTQAGCGRQTERRAGTRFDEPSPGPMQPPGVPDAVIQAVVNTAAARCRSAQFDAMTFMAEAVKTNTMIAARLQSISDIAMRMARKAQRVSRRPGRWESPADIFSRYWFEGRFGWLPLVYDVNDAIAALHVKRRDIAVGRNAQVITFQDGDSSSTGSGTRWDTTRTISGTHKVSGYAVAELSGGLNAVGFDPLVTGWEVVPYSFLIDYFIDIGGYLQAITPFSDVNLAVTSASIVTDYSATVSRIATWHPDGSFSQAGGVVAGGSLTYRVRQYTRFPYPVGLPGWNPRLSVPRMVDISLLSLRALQRVLRALG